MYSKLIVMVYKKFTPSQLSNGPWDFSDRELGIEIIGGTVSITYFSQSKQKEVTVESNDRQILPKKSPHDFRGLIASLHDLLPDNKKVYNGYVKAWGSKDYDIIAEAIGRIYDAAFPNAVGNTGTRLPSFSFTPTDLEIDEHIPRGSFTPRDPTRYEIEMFPLFLSLEGDDPDDTLELVAFERKLLLATTLEGKLTATISYKLGGIDQFKFSIESIPNERRSLEEWLKYYFEDQEEDLAQGMIPDNN